MGKLSIVTNSENISGKLKISASNKIYYSDSGEDIELLEGSPKYRPIRCSELSKRLSNRNWNKSETLFISNDNDNITLRYRKYSDDTNLPEGEIDIIDVDNADDNLSFPLTWELSEETKNTIEEMYSDSFDQGTVASEEVCFLKSLKDALNTSKYQESIDLVKGYDSYTNSLSLIELIEYSPYPGTTGRIDLSIKYSKVSSDNTSVSVYNYFTMFKAFEYSNGGVLYIDDTIEIIHDTSDDLIRVEYLGGTIRLFPISHKISECIIDNCTLVYGNLR